MALPILVLLLVTASFAQAAPITWHASSTLSGVHDPFGLLTGLEPGTPWSLAFSFDPEAPATVIAPGCNSYNIGAATLQLGGYTYTQAGGTAYTNHSFADAGCYSSDISPLGLVQFVWGTNWAMEAGAWHLNRSPGFLIAGYYDTAAVDGGLPSVPSIFGPGPFAGLHHRGAAGDQAFVSGFSPQAMTQPTPVPEPATVAMMAAGLAALAARRRRLTSPR